MARKCIVLMWVVMSCCPVLAASYFTGGGDAVSWSDASNWTDAAVPTSGTTAFIGRNASQVFDVAAYSAATCTAYRLYVGTEDDPVAASLTAFSDVDVYQTYSGPLGELTIEGGVFSTDKGYFKGTVVTINGGTLQINSSSWTLNGYNGVDSILYLQNGDLEILNGTQFSDYSSGSLSNPNTEFTGVIDIYTGTMTMQGDCTAAIAWHISNGNIIGHNGVGTLSYYYDSNTNTTVVTSSIGSAANTYFQGDGDAISWTDASNWSSAGVPGYDKNAFIGRYASQMVDVIADGSTISTPRKLYVGTEDDPVTASLTVYNDFYLYQMYSGPLGAFTLEDGLFSTDKGYFKGTVVIISGGTLRINTSSWTLNGYNGVDTVLYLYDGVLDIHNGTQFSDYSSGSLSNPNTEFTGLIDIYAGVMKLQGDCTAAIAWHINNGNIIAHGGNGTVTYAYNAGTNRTTVKAYDDCFYFDSVNGNDSNTGTSPSQAWQSLSKFNSATFQPGDHIYFKAGCTWNGCMEIGDAWGPAQGSGTAANPIVIDAYGDISNKNNKPRINGYPYGNDTLKIQSIEYWEINNLQLTNDGPTDATPRTGVSVSSVNYGQMNHIYLKDLYIHDVRGVSSLDGWGTGAISTGRWDPDGGQYESYLNDILIEDCYIEDADPYGVFIGGGSKLLSEQQATNVVVRGNYFEDLRSSAVLVTGTESALVEYNEVNTAKGVGMWPFAAHNTLFQYNEVYNTVNEEGDDGNAYDCDYECTGTTYQYNYSHDNPGGFMLICNEPQNPDNVYGNQNPTIRYNISINDGSSDESIFYCWKEVTNASIYNNFIYIPSGKDVHLVSTGHTYGDDSLYIWNNNIIYSHGTARYLVNDDSTHWWDNNCFYGTHKKVWYRIGDFIIWQDGHPSGNNNITSNPNVVSLSYGYGFDSIVGYKLWSNSPCIGAGLPKYPGGEDFWGNPLFTGNPDIGPHEQ